MAIIPQKRLLDWTQIDAASDLERLNLVLQALPDEALMQVLERHRGKGRDDYPVRCTWNSLVAGVVFGHSSIAALRRELRRNAQLRSACGFNPLAGSKAVPSDAAYTHFLANLLEHEEEIRELFHELVEALARELPDLGMSMAIDGKALPSIAKPRKEDAPLRRLDGQLDRRGDPDATWGVKTKRSTRSDGTVYEKVTRWFGFELHLLVDSRHELPLDYEVTTASVGESPLLLPIVKRTLARHPSIGGNARELSADKGYDSAENNAVLLDEWRIHPIIAKRADWKDPDETRPLDPKVVDTVVYDVLGSVRCVCPETAEVRPMVPWGYEADRQRLKYRCPAAVGGYPCKGRERCPGAQTTYGKVVRIPLANDRRLFTPVARDTAAWKRAYARRTAVERVNSRIDRVLGFELHTIRGQAKMSTRMGIALVALLAMALGRIQANQKERMRSLFAPPPLPRAA